jgi:hypothetical protein
MKALEISATGRLAVKSLHVQTPNPHAREDALITPQLYKLIPVVETAPGTIFPAELLEATPTGQAPPKRHAARKAIGQATDPDAPAGILPTVVHWIMKLNIHVGKMM